MIAPVIFVILLIACPPLALVFLVIAWAFGAQWTQGKGKL